jgi:hypothetical protein
MENCLNKMIKVDINDKTILINKLSNILENLKVSHEINAENNIIKCKKIEKSESSIFDINILNNDNKYELGLYKYTTGEKIFIKIFYEINNAFGNICQKKNHKIIDLKDLPIEIKNSTETNNITSLIKHIIENDGNKNLAIELLTDDCEKIFTQNNNDMLWIISNLLNENISDIHVQYTINFIATNIENNIFYDKLKNCVDITNKLIFLFFQEKIKLENIQSIKEIKYILKKILVIENDNDINKDNEILWNYIIEYINKNNLEKNNIIKMYINYGNIMENINA